MTGAPGPSPGPDDGLTDRIAVVADRMGRALADLLGTRLGITPGEWRLLSVLARSGPTSANAAGVRAAMDKVQVSRAVARATAAGHVDRRIDGDDRRRSVLSLTPRGRALHDAAVPLVRDLKDRLLADLDAGERTALGDLLDRVGRRAGEAGGRPALDGPAGS